MVKPSHFDLWTLAMEHRSIDPTELAEAVEQQAENETLDFRTRLLIRDSLSALDTFWGPARFANWLSASKRRDRLEEISKEILGPPGFSLLIHGIMETTRIETVLQFFRELGLSIKSPASIAVGGSASLILQNYMQCKTEDIDVVDELPVQIRSEHDLLNDLAQRFRLRLTHFQSHYLSAGWEGRLHWLDKFGLLDVRLVDPKDIFLSKLFSKREKDRDDLRALAGQLDQLQIVQILSEDCKTLRGEKELEENAKKNWYIIYGEPLPG